MIYELEVRFYGLYGSNLFVSFLQHYFEKNLVQKSRDTVYGFSDGVRAIFSEENELISTMQKKNVIEKKYPEMKYSVSTEQDIHISDLDLDNAKIKRIRERYAYLFSTGLSLHITKINNLFYEVEVEEEIQESDLNDRVKDLFQEKFNIFYNEINPYFEAFRSFLDKFNDNSKAPPGMMSRTVISKPRDINKQDFITVNDKGIIEGYSLTIKGNGVPVILYFKDRYLFMVSLNIYFKLVREINISTIIPEEFMIIGEYFESLNMFTPFDLLFWSRQKNIRDLSDHLKRLEYAYDILDRNSETILKDSLVIYKKDFINVGKTPSSFAKAYASIKKKEYPFTSDGMILTPMYYPQNRILWKPNEKRQLSKYPEVLKIKPWHELSIDFIVDIHNKNVFTSCDKNPYTGTETFPFDAKTMVDWDSIPEEMHLKIVELAPYRDDSKIYLKFSRDRPDKNEPNFKFHTDDVWSRIQDPIEEIVFLAKDLYRLRLQNNRIKKELLSTIPKKSIVVDIGTGNGGDILKYNNIASVVICVEPDKDNRTELQNRLSKFKSILTTKFEILSCGGEDHETIMKTFIPIRNSMVDAPVAVVSMLSMTFFWKIMTC